jgi:hypothetical protein
MEFPVFFPNIKTKSTKQIIIRFLTENKELTNQEIFLKIRKEFAIKVTYQAVRQALTELATEKVLTKKEKLYSITKNWIENLYEFSNLLKEKYVDSKEIKIIDEKTKEITLNSLEELGLFVLYNFKDKYFDINNSQDLFMFVHNLWFPFFNKNKHNQLKEFFSTNKNYVICKNKGIINRVLSSFYKKFGKVKMGIKFDEFFDLIVQGDCIVKIHIPEKLRKKMKKTYTTKNPFSFRSIDNFLNITYEKFQIKLIITRDKIISEEIKERFQKIMK